MNKNMIVNSFWSIFVISFLVVGYVRGTFFMSIDWVDGATLWQKFVQFYLKSFFQNLIPAFVIALILGFVFNLIATNKNLKK